MKKIIIIVVAVTVAIVTSGLLAGVFQLNRPNYATQLKSLIEDKWADYIANKTGIDGGLAMLILSPKGNFFASAGINVTADTHFRAASTTKTFTAAAIMLLNQEGKLRIDDKITDHIPGTNITYVPDSSAYDIPNKEKITIQQILEHRAGIFDVSNTKIPDNVSAPYAGEYYIDYIKEKLNQPEHTFTYDELVGIVATNRLSYFPPGTGFHYSNTGFSILGKIIEQVSGLSYASFIEKFLLVPNRLTETTLPALGQERLLPTPYVEGYVWTQGDIYDVTAENMSPHVAEGNIITTPNNLAKWARVLYSAQAGINQTYVDLMKSVMPTGEEHGVYGLGTTFTEGLGYGHNGAHAGYLTVMRYDPATDATVVIYTTMLNADDIYGEVDFMYDVGRSAKQLLEH